MESANQNDINAVFKTFDYFVRLIMKSIIMLDKSLEKRTEFQAEFRPVFDAIEGLVKRMTGGNWKIVLELLLKHLPSSFPTLLKLFSDVELADFAVRVVSAIPPALDIGRNTTNFLVDVIKGPLFNGEPSRKRVRPSTPSGAALPVPCGLPWPRRVAPCASFGHLW